MHLKTLFPLSLLLFLLFHGHAFSAGFEKVWSKPFMSEDLDRFTDLILFENHAILLFNVINYHASARGVVIEKLILSDFPQDETEYKSLYGPQKWRIPLWSLAYESGDRLPPIDSSLNLQNRLLLIDSIVHAPDYGGYSHRFTINGEYLGRFPNFAAVEEQYLRESGITPLTIKGQPLQFPLTLHNIVYTSVIRLKDTLLLLSPQQITSVGITDLNTNGDEATFHSFPRNTKYIIIQLIKGNYFLIGGELFMANPKDLIRKIPLQTRPAESFSTWSHIKGDYFYQVEQKVSALVFLSKYRIVGLQGLSAINNSIWENYHETGSK